jgi:hypothetical protein
MLDTAFWIQIALTVGGLGATGGAIINRIKALETKQEKYNNLQERTAINERDTSAAHRRLDERTTIDHDIRERIDRIIELQQQHILEFHARKGE